MKKKARNQNKQVLKKYNSIKGPKKTAMEATMQAADPGDYPEIDAEVEDKR